MFYPAVFAICHIFLEPFMCIGCGILFDGRERRLTDEPEIELTATTLNHQVRDAGVDGTGGVLTHKRLRLAGDATVFFLLRRVDGLLVDEIRAG